MVCSGCAAVGGNSKGMVLGMTGMEAVLSASACWQHFCPWVSHWKCCRGRAALGGFWKGEVLESEHERFAVLFAVTYLVTMLRACFVHDW